MIIFFLLLLAFFSIQSNVHYDTSNNLGAAYRRMKAEGKNELVLGEGEWRVEKGDTLRGEGEYFLLDKSTKIIGQGRGETTLVGLKVHKNKPPNQSSEVHARMFLGDRLVPQGFCYFFNYLTGV